MSNPPVKRIVIRGGVHVIAHEVIVFRDDPQAQQVLDAMDKIFIARTQVVMLSRSQICSEGQLALEVAEHGLSQLEKRGYLTQEEEYIWPSDVFANRYAYHSRPKEA